MTVERRLVCMYVCGLLKVFLVRKIKGNDSGHLYAMKVLKKATLKGSLCYCCFLNCTNSVFEKYTVSQKNFPPLNSL